MKQFERDSFIFFVLTYVFLITWLYFGVSNGNGYDFCLSTGSPLNIFALLSGICAALTLPFYVNHQKGSTKLLGIITFLFGMSAAIIVFYRFFFMVSMCV